MHPLGYVPLPLAPSLPALSLARVCSALLLAIAVPTRTRVQPDGHDMDNTDTLAQVGLGFTCDFSKPNGGFIGQTAHEAEKARGLGQLPRRLAQVLVNDPEPLLYHGEVLYRDGVVVGDVRAGSYGHTLGGAVGLAMVDAAPVRLFYLPLHFTRILLTI